MYCLFDEIWCRFCEMDKSKLDEVNRKTGKSHGNE